MQLGKGQKIPLDENFLTLKFERPDSALEIDTAAFLTNGGGKVAGDEDFVFYGNARHISGAVTHNGNDSIDVDLSRIPRHVERVSLTATIYDADNRRQNFSMIRDARLRIFGTSGEIATFPLEDFTVETAIVLGEIYRYKGTWKFSAIGAGYKGGLAALCNSFGIEVKDVAPTAPPEIERPKINTRRERPRKKTSNDAQQKKVATPPPEHEEISPPKKIELRKGQKVSLFKPGNRLGEIVISLNWNQSRFGFGVPVRVQGRDDWRGSSIGRLLRQIESSAVHCAKRQN